MGGQPWRGGALLQQRHLSAADCVPVAQKGGRGGRHVGHVALKHVSHARGGAVVALQRSRSGGAVGGAEAARALAARGGDGRESASRARCRNYAGCERVACAHERCQLARIRRHDDGGGRGTSRVRNTVVEQPKGRIGAIAAVALRQQHRVERHLRAVLRCGAEATRFELKRGAPGRLPRPQLRLHCRIQLSLQPRPRSPHHLLHVSNAVQLQRGIRLAARPRRHHGRAATAQRSHPRSGVWRGA
jgi:hypothetical protein